MPHKNEVCFRTKCRHEFANHINGKCNLCACDSFEFIPFSSRKREGKDSMIDFTVMIASKNSKQKYEVIVWLYGDFSCRCTGWRTHRTCKHIDRVAANIEYYRREDGKLQAASGSVSEAVQSLRNKMDDAEAAVRRGDPVELNRLQAEIEMQQQMFEAAGMGLGERFANVMANIRQHAYADILPARDAKPAQSIEVKQDNVFGADEDPFAD